MVLEDLFPASKNQIYEKKSFKTDKKESPPDLIDFWTRREPKLWRTGFSSTVIRRLLEFQTHVNKKQMIFEYLKHCIECPIVSRYLYLVP